jgi:2-methylisocitrate lyase-like PEP mutase family enzyme
MNVPAPLSPAKLLRSLLARRPIVVAPGVYDALSAHLAAEAGFPAVFVSGSALAYSRLARPDVNLLAVTEVADAVARIRERIDLPLLVDADSGHGNAVNVQRTVRMLEAAGASAIQIEDQVNHKNPGALAARPLVPLAEMIGKLKAALDARRDAATVISARTDAVFTAGVDEGIRRGVAFAEAGADMVFVEGLAARADMERLIAAIGGKAPLLHNIIDGGASPVQTAADAEALGYAIVLFPGAAVQAAATAMASSLKQLRAEGTTAAFRARNLDAKGLNGVLGTPAFLEAAKRYDPASNG